MADIINGQFIAGQFLLATVVIVSSLPGVNMITIFDLSN